MNGHNGSEWQSLLVVAVFAAGCATVPPGTTGSRETISFEEFSLGEIVSEISASSGKVIRVKGENPAYRTNGAVIFDSANWTDDDQDLATPHRDFEIELADGTRVPGPGIGVGGSRGSLCENDEPLGKMLIVDEDLVPMTDEGRVAQPDDEGQIGAKLFLDFTSMGSVTIHDITFIDVEELPGKLRLYSVGLDAGVKRDDPRRLLADYRFRTLNNGVLRIFREELRTAPEEGCYVRLNFRRHGKVLTPISGVRLLEVDFAGSGAIDNIVYSVDSRKRLFK